MKDPVTTLMLRGVPPRYHQEQLFQEIAEVAGPAAADSIDLLCLPWDSRRGCSAGFAFVNCRDAAAAEEYRRLLDGHPFRGSAQREECKVFTAHVQGLENNLVHLVGTAGLGAHQPLIMWQGHRLDLSRIVASLPALPGEPARSPLSEPNRARSAAGGGPPPKQEPGSAGPQLRAAPREPASVDEPPGMKKSKVGLSSGKGAASTRAPSSFPSSPVSGSLGGEAGDVCGGDDHFGLSLVEASLAQRVWAVMLEKRIPPPVVAPRGAASSGSPSAAELFGDGGQGGDEAPGAPPPPPRGGARPGRASDAGSVAPAVGGPAAPPHVDSDLTLGGLADASGLGEGAAARAGGPPPADDARVLELPRDPTSRALSRFFEMHSAAAVAARRPAGGGCGGGGGCADDLAARLEALLEGRCVAGRAALPRLGADRLGPSSGVISV